jgi:hypothetical protein
MKIIPIVASALFVALVACAGSDQVSPGVANPQAPNTCLDRSAACAKSSDCCSLWCVNGECRQKQALEQVEDGYRSASR